MKRFSNWIANHPVMILVISILLLIPTIFGYVHTRINYDILVYLPENVETIKGQKILTEDFGIGSYAFVMISNPTAKDVLKLEQNIQSVEGVEQVVSIYDVIDTTIPYEMLPEEIVSKLYKEDETVLLVTFSESTSTDQTILGVQKLRELVGNANSVSSMTSMVIDTMDISNQELLVYIVIAVILCVVVLVFATDSYFIPVLLLSNIGVAILYNMGSNIFLGEISYITKAITAILQLGVTTDFSIFLYHKYQQARVDNSNYTKNEAMALAIQQTFKSVIGSSLTTFAGFLALCTMDLTLGMDIGLVMAKGVVCGLICVLTLFPALLLVFDSIIEKTKHRNFFPKFERIQKFSVQHYVFIIICFLFLLIPAWIGNSNYQVYYKLDESLPKDLPFQIANSSLAEKFNIVSPEIILVDKDMKQNDIKELVSDLKEISGIDFVFSPSVFTNPSMISLLPEDLQDILNNDQYQMILINSNYTIASSLLNEQIEEVEQLVKSYDKHGIVAGEGALMKDLVTIADHDFKMVNYTSIFVIFLIMLVVLKSIALPVILVLTIEFAIFLNMAVAYFTGTSLPFIASIIVGTIQLGATIDYAILMSTRYLEERGKDVAKKEAMKVTLKYTVPSIVTSALCFFAATFGVACYTKIDMIGSICELLARGSIISMLVVILILPALLMVFDFLIMKTTKIKKEGI